MSVVRQAILHVSAVVVVVDVVAAARLPGTAGALAMVGGATVLAVADRRHVVVCHLHAGTTIAGHHRIVAGRRLRLQTEMDLRTGVVAGADYYGNQLFTNPGTCCMC
ncbi:hypothetical protein L1987_72365 [Smallanthus sonchifolius]|uniref:Uncharacterized protein n=1 Tax=Smallanthus sonchifolius TaxID=185202 RepID=A0ACB9AUL9_9ASTR|nr:hypothetical protein L1987_72365 [Smallanthus sonchifolius]